MLRNIRSYHIFRKFSITACLPAQTFLTNEYKCAEAWNTQTSSSFISKVNLNDFYNILEQSYASKGVLSAIDVDIFANAVKDPTYLDELRDLLHKLRLTAETQNTLESTHHATIRNYLEYGNLSDLVNMLCDPLNFGVFLDFYTANMLLDKLLSTEQYELAAQVASTVMLQEDYSHAITNSLCKYACYKYLLQPKQDSPPVEDTNKKVEEKKIRIKFLRNPFFDDHFDLKDLHLLSGKTLAWMSRKDTDNVNNNLQIIGWLFYKKFDKFSSTVEELCKISTFKLYQEVLELVNTQLQTLNDDDKNLIQTSVELLNSASVAEVKLEDSMKKEIENAINRLQNKDISSQKELFGTWVKIREERLEEQAKRLDRAKRVKDIEEKQKTIVVEEQKLWFFENEEKIDLQIEEKEEKSQITTSKTTKEKNDENYIPPEILPKKRS
ncbi:uncharacterized protein LOC121728832 [Aricia agestis]|uniref:uncharacterized protein LOC121728832 n=1 Tax=Aricia agestis TaxID=91739 RepID=UPI001C20AE98|nr:uncharacterized protein LOC121728832 [Aricia agestis]